MEKSRKDISKTKLLLSLLSRFGTQFGAIYGMSQLRHVSPSSCVIAAGKSPHRSPVQFITTLFLDTTRYGLCAVDMPREQVDCRLARRAERALITACHSIADFGNQGFHRAFI